jgi:hypothetical protein
MEYAYLIPSSFQSNENSLTTAKIFFRRLSRLTDSFLSEKTNWDGILLTGSLVCAMMQTEFNPELYLDSDIDLFVYHPTARCEIIYNLLKRFTNIKTNYAGLYNIRLPNERIIQIVQNKCTNPDLIIENFDMSNCQAGYTGNRFIYTDDYIESVKTRIGSINKKYVRIDRLIKNYKRGITTAVIDPNIEVVYPKGILGGVNYLTIADFANNSQILSGYTNIEWSHVHSVHVSLYLFGSTITRECIFSRTMNMTQYLLNDN